MSSETRPNEDLTPTAPTAERMVTHGTSNVAVGGHVKDTTIVTGDGNQFGHQAGRDVIVGDKTVIHHHLSLKWLLPFLLVIAAGVCVIAWQASRQRITEDDKPHSTPAPVAAPSPTAIPTPTLTPSPTPAADRKKTPARSGKGVVIVDQTVEKK